MSKAKTTPLFEMKAGKLKIAAWEHPSQNPNNLARLSFTLQRSYKKDDKWVHDTVTLFPEDLAHLDDVIQATRQRAFVKYTEMAESTQ